MAQLDEERKSWMAEAKVRLERRTSRILLRSKHVARRRAHQEAKTKFGLRAAAMSKLRRATASNLRLAVSCGVCRRAPVLPVVVNCGHRYEESEKADPSLIAAFPFVASAVRA